MYAARLDIASLEIRELYAPKWDVEFAVPSPDGREVVLVVNEDGHSRLLVQTLESQSATDAGRVRQLMAPSMPRGVISPVYDGGPRWSAQGDAIVFSLSSPTQATDVWLWDRRADEVRRLTHSDLGELPAALFREPELVRYGAFDGLEIPAWYYTPVEAQKSPVIIYIHGGPEAQIPASFNPIIQYLLHRGYSVLAPNVRGSTGYGKRYSHLDDIEKRMDSVADIAAAMPFLEARGADTERVAVMGGSYGGFMVLSCVTTYPDLFAAGVDIVGIANFVTFLENTGAWRRAVREAEYGSLEHDREFLERISPLNNVNDIKAPLMVIHGANDPRVPVGEAEQIVDRLRQRDVPVTYLRYEDEGHGLVKLANRLDAYPKMADFLDRHLRQKVSV